MTNKVATMLGLAIGDALGQPFEFCDTNKIIQAKWDGSFIRGDLWKLKPGQWTDDTKMAICIAESLIKHGSFIPDQVAANYVDWVASGDLRGIGMACEKAIYKMSSGINPIECGNKESGRPKPSFKRIGPETKQADGDDLHAMRGDFCGCGTVMRCAPIGLFFRKDGQLAQTAAALDATMTHDHPDARDSSIFLVEAVRSLLIGESKYNVCKTLSGKSFIDFEYSHVPQLVKEAIVIAESGAHFSDAIVLGTRGTAHETLASAIYCFLRYDNFQESVIASVLMGGDTDSRAAIVGALAGTYYGLDGIPNEYVCGVEDSERLILMDEKLYGGKQ